MLRNFILSQDFFKSINHSPGFSKSRTLSTSRMGTKFEHVHVGLVILQGYDIVCEGRTPFYRACKMPSQCFLNVLTSKMDSWLNQTSSDVFFLLIVKTYRSRVVIDVHLYMKFVLTMYEKMNFKISNMAVGGCLYKQEFQNL